VKPALFCLSAACYAAILALPVRAQHIDLGLRIGIPAPIIVEQAPPRPVVERMVVSPGPGYVWIAGHHSWMNGRWVWISGVWVLPPQPGAYYVEGRWDDRSRNWIEGHWEIVAAPTPPPMVEEYAGEAPPPPRQEIIVAQPGPEYVWIGGYWAWHHHHHEWIAGRWERPPHGRHEWVAPRWEHRGGSYVFIEGSWR
jgi:hypothetical protein